MDRLKLTLGKKWCNITIGYEYQNFGLLPPPGQFLLQETSQSIKRLIRGTLRGQDRSRVEPLLQRDPKRNYRKDWQLNKKLGFDFHVEGHRWQQRCISGLESDLNITLFKWRESLLCFQYSSQHVQSEESRRGGVGGQNPVQKHPLRALVGRRPAKGR